MIDQQVKLKPPDAVGSTKTGVRGPPSPPNVRPIHLIFDKIFRAAAPLSTCRSRDDAAEAAPNTAPQPRRSLISSCRTRSMAATRPRQEGRAGVDACQALTRPDPATGAARGDAQAAAPPKRWTVERTIAWLNRCRRLAKGWACLTRNGLAVLRWASVRLMPRKLCQAKT